MSTPDPDPPTWSFDVITARHDDLEQGGRYPTQRSRVAVSCADFAHWPAAAEVAACMAVIRHGGMPIAILPRY